MKHVSLHHVDLVIGDGIFESGVHGVAQIHGEYVSRPLTQCFLGMTPGAAAGIQYSFPFKKALSNGADSGGEVVVVIMLEFIPFIAESIDGIFLAPDFESTDKIFPLLFSQQRQ